MLSIFRGKMSAIVMFHKWICCSRFSDLRFVNLKELMEADLPLLPSEFESLIKKQCWDAHEVLRKKYVIV